MLDGNIKTRISKERLIDWFIKLIKWIIEWGFRKIEECFLRFNSNLGEWHVFNKEIVVRERGPIKGS